MKRLFSLLTVLAVTVCQAFAIAEKPANGYVGDYASVLEESTEEHIIEANEKLFEATGAEIVVVSVDFMDGMYADDYAKACFDAWGIGDVERDNGLLLVFAVGENRAWAMQGKGIENALTASRLEDMLDTYFYGPYDEGDYDTAALDFFDAAYGWFDSYYGGIDGAAGEGSGAPVQPAPGGSVSYAQENGFGYAVLGVIGLLVGVLVLLAVFDAARYRSYRRRYLMPGMPPPAVIFRPILFGRRRYRPAPPPPPPGGGRVPGPGPGPSFFSGGAARGGGAGRRGGSAGFSGGSAFRSGGSSFRGGRSSSRGGGFHSGGRSRGGGAGRR